MIWILVILLAVLLLAVWFKKSVRFTGPAERGVKVIFGKPVAVVESGSHFVPWLPRCFTKIFPTTKFRLSFPGAEVITAERAYKEKEYGALILKMHVVMYLSFPPGDNLIKIYQAKIPTDDQGLTEWAGEKVLGVLRNVVGKMSWGGIIEKRKQIREKTEKILKDPDGVFAQVGFRPEDYEIEITQITPPEVVSEALSKTEKFKYETVQAKYVSEKRAQELAGTLIRMEAKETGKSENEIRAEINKNPEFKKEWQRRNKELLETQMALEKNSFVKIKVDGAHGIEKSILNILAAGKRMPMGLGEKVRKTPEESELTYEEKSKRGLKELGIDMI